MEAWKELTACIFSPQRSQKLTSAALVVSALIAFAQGLPIVHNVQERSTALSKSLYNNASSSSNGENTVQSYTHTGASCGMPSAIVCLTHIAVYIEEERSLEC